MLEYRGNGWFAIVNEHNLSVLKLGPTAPEQHAIYIVNDYDKAQDAILDSNHNFNDLIKNLKNAEDNGDIKLFIGKLNGVQYNHE